MSIRDSHIPVPWFAAQHSRESAAKSQNKEHGVSIGFIIQGHSGLCREMILTS